MNFDNPAFRLVTLLKEGKKIPHETHCRKAWAQLFGVNENSPELFSRLGKTMGIASEIISELRLAYPDEPENFDHWNNQLNAAFSGNELNSQWSTFISHIDIHTITYLELNASRINNKFSTKAANLEELKKIRVDLNEILASITASEIEHGVKTSLCRNLRKLIEAIDEYNITGTKAMFDAIEIVMGHSVFDPQYKQVLTNTENGKKIVTLISTLADMLAISQGLPQVTEAVKFLIAKINN